MADTNAVETTTAVDDGEVEITTPTIHPGQLEIDLEAPAEPTVSSEVPEAEAPAEPTDSPEAAEADGRAVDAKSSADTASVADMTNESAPEAEAGHSGPQFADLDLRPQLQATLAKLGYSSPTPIQAEAIPPLLVGRDLLGQAATGTGKTAAFALPLIDQIQRTGATAGSRPLGLILTPTRELAVQVADAITGYGRLPDRDSSIRVVAVYGGQPVPIQLKALSRGAHVVVATPGRAVDLIKRRSLKLDAVNTVILDEADEMLDMGFTEDIEAILSATPEDRQTVMFSATMPPRINAIAKRHQNDPVRIKIVADTAKEGQALVRQSAYIVHRVNKPSALGRLLDVESPTSALVFCATRNEVDELTGTMNNRGYRAEALHGGMDQKQRDRVMGRLRDGSANVLIATDVAARGLDVDTLSHVVNYNVPTAPESYVHRIGRVGRAGREGVAITLVEPRHRRLISNIERLTKTKIEVAKVPTVADLHKSQLQRTTAAVTEYLGAATSETTGSDPTDYSGAFEALLAANPAASERDIALATLAALHKERVGELDTAEIPDASSQQSKKNSHRKGSKSEGRSGKYEAKGGKGGRYEGKGGGKRPTPGGASVFINLGNKANIRPGDLVGAIANETGLSGKDIGPIRIGDFYSVVGVPEDAVERVISAISKTTIKGKKAKIRRYVD